MGIINFNGILRFHLCLVVPLLQVVQGSQSLVCVTGKSLTRCIIIFLQVKPLDGLFHLLPQNLYPPLLGSFFVFILPLVFQIEYFLEKNN